MHRREPFSRVRLVAIAAAVFLSATWVAAQQSNDGREANMVAFAVAALELLDQCLGEV